MQIKHLINYTTLLFTILTLISGINDTINGIYTTNYFNLFLRLALCIVGAGSTYLFYALSNLPLRLVQVIHYLVSILLVVFVLLLSHLIEPLNLHYFINILYSYTVVYIFMTILYEIRFRKIVKQKNRLLEKLNQDK